MKKLMMLITVLMSVLVVVACQSQDNEGTSKETLKNIFEETKAEIVHALKADGVEEPLIDGKLASHMEVDLMDEKDEQSDFYLDMLQINRDQLAGGYVIASMMNVNSNEIIMLEAKEKSEVPALEEALKAELEAQTQTWETYLPDQFEKVKNNKILTNGNILMYITYDEPEKLEEIFNQKTK